MLGKRQLIIAAILLAYAILAMPARAEAVEETFTVNSTADTGDGMCTSSDCTLRDAIADADDGEADQDHINISFNSVFNSTITVGSTLPTINEPLSIASTGLAPAAVSGNHAVRPFLIVAPNGTDVNISLLRIEKGSAAGAGGAISSKGADLVISNSTIAGNSTSGNSAPGGGVYATGDLTIRRSTVSGNHTSGDGSGGGGISANNSTVAIEDSTISDNYTDGLQGSGGGVEFGDATVTILDSTLSGNHTGPGGPGGAISVGNVDLKLDTSTISGNHTTGGNAHGGGIYSGSGAATTIKNSTIYDNYVGAGSTSDGGGIHATGNSADPALSNTIVANNRVYPFIFPEPEDLATPNDTFQLAFTLVEERAGAPTANAVPGSNIFGTDPRLGPLVFNGGRTRNHRPEATSPVVDQGSTARATDQRGRARPLDFPHVPNSSAAGADGADIGSVEPSRAEGPPGGSCAGLGATIVGTNGPDFLRGTGKRDIVDAMGANDIVFGLGGRDIVCGRGGRDREFGGGGNDRLLGNAASDKLLGGKGKDKLLGGKGKDKLLGGPGRDRLRGGPGRDRQRQ